MTNNVEDIMSRQPHFSIETLGGNVHVIPLKFFQEVSTGVRRMSELEDLDLIMPTVINEWLRTKK